MVTDLLAISGELKAAVNLVALIDRDVRLTRHGKRHVGVCPFHAEQTPNFTVTVARLLATNIKFVARARDALGETRP